jgi:nucleoside-diphosphate-sugar epimerase
MYSTHNPGIRVLVTGGSGFIGTNLVEHLLSAGREVLSLDTQPPQNPAHEAVFRRADILDAAAVREAFAAFAPTAVVHLAARTDLVETGRLDDYRANTAGVANVVAAVRGRTSVQRAVFASTKLVCPSGYRPRSGEECRPDTLYGRSKAVSERLVREANLPCCWCIVRPTSIWGPWGGAPYRGFFLAVARGRYVHPGRVDPPKSFGYVGNVVFQIDRLLAAPAERVRGRTFYLADYAPCTIRGWADLIAARLGRRPVRSVPRLAAFAAAAAGSLLKRLGVSDPPLTLFRLANMWKDTTGLPLEATREITGELPFTLEQGVDETLRWMRRQGMIK